jgi:hypothetical protein
MWNSFIDLLVSVMSQFSVFPDSHRTYNPFYFASYYGSPCSIDN